MSATRILGEHQRSPERNGPKSDPRHRTKRLEARAIASPTGAGTKLYVLHTAADEWKQMQTGMIPDEYMILNAARRVLAERAGKGDMVRDTAGKKDQGRK
jgi:hypothetical protein